MSLISAFATGARSSGATPGFAGASVGGGVLALVGGAVVAAIGALAAVGGGGVQIVGGQPSVSVGASVSAVAGDIQVAGGQASANVGGAVSVSAGGGAVQIAGGLVTASSGAPANSRQVTIHVQEARLTGDLTDFPVLITRSGLPNEMVDPAGANRARADGGDLRAFVMVASVKTAIPLEVAEFAYDSASAAGDAICNIYVKVPSLLVVSGADILLEYGDASLTQPAVTDPLGRNAVWSDAAYVTHDLVKDSTGATADAVWTGSINSVRTPVGLKAVEMGFTLTGDDTGKITTSFAADQRPISYLATYRYSTNQTVLGYLWTHGGNAMQAMNGTRRWEYHRKYNGVDQIWRASIAQASGTNWRQQAALHDINALASPEQYRDETLLTLNAVGTPSNPIDALTGTLIIGNDSGGATSWRGGIGPLWIWKTVVSTAFLITRFRMMNNPAAFLSVGTPISI